MFRPVVDVICTTTIFHCYLFIFVALLIFLSPGAGVEPQPVVNLTLTNSTSSSLQVSWSKYDCGILPDKFLYYKYYLNGVLTGLNKTLTTSFYTFWNLKPLQTYQLEVEVTVGSKTTAIKEITACTGQYLFLLHLVTVQFNRV